MELAVRDTPIEITRGTVVVVLVGLALIGYGGYDYAQQSSAVEDAETVEATVGETSVYESGGRRGTDYHVRIEFTYRYQGTEYTGDQLYPGSIGRSFDTRSAAESAIEPYDEGETVTAYVDPSDPGDGFLERRTTRGPIQLVAIGAVLIVVIALNAIGERRPGQGTELRPVGEHERRPYRTLFGVDRDRVHRLSKRLMATAVVAIPLSVIGIAVLLVASDSGGGSGSPRQVGLTDPIGVLLGALMLAAAALLVSLSLYCLWSFTEYRRLRERIPEPRPPSPFRHPSRLVTVLLGNYDLDDYGKRVQRTGFALLVTGGLVGALVRILLF